MNKTIGELHREIVRARKLGLSLAEVPKGLSSFDRARAQHVVERIRSLTRVVEQRCSVQLPSDLNGLDRAIMDIDVQPEGLAMPRFPHTVSAEMRADFIEMQRCLEASCFRSAIVLCARMLETALHCKYYEVTGNDLLEKAPGTGLGSLVAKLAEKNVLVDPGLANQIHLINQVRVHSVHKKSTLFEPTEEQARAIVLYTLDAIRKLFA